MSPERVECSRCGATFDSEDDLMVHSIETHAGQPVGGAGDGAGGDAPVAADGDPADRAADALDPRTVDRLLGALEEREGSEGSVLVQYGQRFLLVVGVVVLVLGLLLTYLHATGIIGTAVYTFSLGTLFGVTLSYLQGFVQSVRR